MGRIESGLGRPGSLDILSDEIRARSLPAPKPPAAPPVRQTPSRPLPDTRRRPTPTPGRRG